MGISLPYATQAETISSFVPVTTGVFDDPSLVGYTTYAYRVDAPTDWTNSDLHVKLTSGTLNHVQPAFLGSPSNVNGFGDSAAMAPTLVPGDLTGGFMGTVGFAGTQLETPTELLTSWFTTDHDNIGIFDIATITLSDDANGTLAYRTISGFAVEFGPSGRESVPYDELLPDLRIVNGQIVALETTLPPDPPNPDPPGSGATSTVFVPVENGNFDNSALDGFTTYAMRVTATTDWTNADLQVILTEGTIVHSPPAFLGSPNGANGLGDSAGIAPTLVAGDLTAGFNGTVGFAGPHVETPTELRTSWFTTESNDIGTFDIAMLTLSNDANGTILFRTIAGADVEDGGFGGSAVDLTVMMVELGKANLVEPFTPTAILGGGLVSALGEKGQKPELLGPLMEGKLQLACAYAEAGSRFNLSNVTTTATVEGDQVKLDGEKINVLNGSNADKLLVVARESGA
ncbi:MAG: acyl-CoA dehydrogenase family protein, partial [Pirellulales bacterium]